MHRFVLRRAAAHAGIVFIVSAASACGDSPTEAAAAQGACAPDGSLSVAIYGDIRRDLRWTTEDLECEGMPRPGDAGARLHFSGGDARGESGPLAFIIGLPELRREETVRETPTIVTLIDEGSGRFFSTADASVCWSDINEQVLIAGDEYTVRGLVYCVSPLAEMNGKGGVTFTDLEFVGRINWGEDQ